MQNLPTPEIYEKEFQYLPWGILIKEIQQIIFEKAPKNGRIVDLMCGPGYLLGQLHKQRLDLECTGVDLDRDFINYARKQYPSLNFIYADVLEWKSDQTFDVVLCTAGLHHVPYERQEILIKKIASLIKPGGFTIVADPYIDNYTNEEERKLAAAKLGYEYLIATIKQGADEDVLRATIQIMANDILMVEYKNSVKKIQPIFQKYFFQNELHKTWPKMDSAYGDYYFFSSQPSQNHPNNP